MSLWFPFLVQEDLAKRLRAWAGLKGCTMESDRASDVPADWLPFVGVYVTTEEKSCASQTGGAAQFNATLTLPIGIRVSATLLESARYQIAEILQQIQCCIFDDVEFLSQWNIERINSANVTVKFSSDGEVHIGQAQLVLELIYFDTYLGRLDGIPALDFVDVTTNTPSGEQIDQQLITTNS